MVNAKLFGIEPAKVRAPSDKTVLPLFLAKKLPSSRVTQSVPIYALELPQQGRNYKSFNTLGFFIHKLLLEEETRLMVAGENALDDTEVNDAISDAALQKFSWFHSPANDDEDVKRYCMLKLVELVRKNMERFSEQGRGQGRILRPESYGRSFYDDDQSLSPLDDGESVIEQEDWENSSTELGARDANGPYRNTTAGAHEGPPQAPKAMMVVPSKARPQQGPRAQAANTDTQISDESQQSQPGTATSLIPRTVMSDEPTQERLYVVIKASDDPLLCPRRESCKYRFEAVHQARRIMIDIMPLLRTQDGIRMVPLLLLRNAYRQEVHWQFPSLAAIPNWDAGLIFLDAFALDYVIDSDERLLRYFVFNAPYTDQHYNMISHQPSPDHPIQAASDMHSGCRRRDEPGSISLGINNYRRLAGPPNPTATTVSE